MLDYALIGLVIMSGTAPGQYHIEYEYVRQYATHRACTRALADQKPQPRVLFTCVRIDRN